MVKHFDLYLGRNIMIVNAAFRGQKIARIEGVAYFEGRLC